MGLKILKFWINSLFRHEKHEFTALEGVFSVFFATMFVCLLSFIIGCIQTASFSIMSFLLDVLIIPAIALAAAFIFVAMVRVSSSFVGGKGTISGEWRAIAPSIGSFIFVAGAFCVIWMSVFSVLWGVAVGTMPEGTAGYIILASKANTIAILFGLFLGIAALVCSYLFGAVQGYWLDGLKAVEGLDVPKTSRLIWLAVGLAVLVAAIVVALIGGMWISSSLYNELVNAGL